MDCSTVKFNTCFESSHCFDGDKSTARCWILVYCQIACSLTLLILLPILRTLISAMKKLKWSRRPKPIKLSNCEKKASFQSNGDNFFDPNLLIGATFSNRAIFPSSVHKSPMSTGDENIVSLPNTTKNTHEEFIAHNESYEDDPELDECTDTRFSGTRILHLQSPAAKFPISTVDENSVSLPNEKKNTHEEFIARDESFEDNPELDVCADARFPSTRISHSPEIVVDESCPLARTSRSEENFIKSNFDPDIQFPSMYGPEYATIIVLTTAQFFKGAVSIFIYGTETRAIIRVSIGCAFLSSGLTSFLVLTFRYSDFMTEMCIANADYSTRNKEDILGAVIAVSRTIDSFKFLPIFLILAYTAFLVERWRKFVITCHQIQGRIHDVGILTGSLVRVPVPLAARKQLYRIYRHLTMVHIVCFASFVPSWAKSDEDISDFGARIGLLTEEEAALVFSMDVSSYSMVIFYLKVPTFKHTSSCYF